MVDAVDFTFTSKHGSAKRHADKIIKVIMEYPGFKNMVKDPSSHIEVVEEQTDRAHVTMRLMGRDLLNRASLERAVERIKRDTRISRIHLEEAFIDPNEKAYADMVFTVTADEPDNYAKYVVHRLLSIDDFENYVVDRHIKYVEDTVNQAQVRIVLHQFGKDIDQNDAVKAALMFLHGQEEQISCRASRLSRLSAQDGKQPTISKIEMEIRKSSLNRLSTKKKAEEFEAKSESDRAISSQSHSAITPPREAEDSVQRKESVLSNKAISVKFQCNGGDVKSFTDILMKELEKVSKFEENKYEQRVSIKGDNKAIVELIMQHYENEYENDPVDEVVAILKREEERVNELAVESIVYCN